MQIKTLAITELSDYDLTAQELSERYSFPDGELKRFPVSWWQSEVQEGVIRSGYWEWLVNMLREEKNNVEQLAFLYDGET